MKKTYLITILFFVNKLFADDGALLFNGNCITCHNSVKSISAPSMREVKRNYLVAFAKKEEFVKYMTLFVIHPNEDMSIMRDAVQKYKIMPILGYEESVINEIAAYIYETDF